MFDRPGLLALMELLKERVVDVIICESLDRLSRDDEDLPAINKRVKFAQAKIISLEGVATDISVGLRALVGKIALKDVADKSRRHHFGRAVEGRKMSKPAYGHRCVEGGQTGEQERDPVTSQYLNRIFIEYANRKPTHAICADLNREGIPGPGGGMWRVSSLTGGAGNGRGLLGNRIYIGEMEWGTHFHILSPYTGKRCRRKAEAKSATATTTPVPHLRIIEQDLWDRVQALRAERSEKRRTAGERTTYAKSDRDYLLAGLLRCATCGGHMRITRGVSRKRNQGARVGCVNANFKGTCDHKKTYALADLDSAVLNGVKHNLDVEALTAYTQGYHEEWSRQQKADAVDRDAVQAQVNRLTVQIDRIVSAIAESDEPVPPLMSKMKELEAKRVGLKEKLRLIQAQGATVTILPRTIQSFRATLVELHDALTGDHLTGEELVRRRAAFKNVFDRIEVHPSAGRGVTPDVTPYARVAAIMGVELFPTMRTTSQMLAEQGVSDLLSNTSGAR